MTDGVTKDTAKPVRPLDPCVPEIVVERLAFYRRVLQNALEDGKTAIYSHQVAAICGTTSAQVRRDIMLLGYLGHPRHGYRVDGLLGKIDEYFGLNETVSMVLVGVGNLGRAILSYFSGKKTHFSLVAAFDADPSKASRTIAGVHCYVDEELERVIVEKKVTVGVIAVPAAEAQKVAGRLVSSGIKGILNLAPVRLKVPHDVFVENFDMTLSLEKVSFFSKIRNRQEGVTG